jgi:hypothetical protein
MKDQRRILLNYVRGSLFQLDSLKSSSKRIIFKLSSFQQNNTKFEKEPREKTLLLYDASTCYRLWMVYTTNFCLNPYKQNRKHQLFYFLLLRRPGLFIPHTQQNNEHVIGKTAYNRSSKHCTGCCLFRVNI